MRACRHGELMIVECPTCLDETENRESTQGILKAVARLIQENEDQRDQITELKKRLAEFTDHECGAW